MLVSRRRTLPSLTATPPRPAWSCSASSAPATITSTASTATPCVVAGTEEAEQGQAGRGGVAVELGCVGRRDTGVAGQLPAAVGLLGASEKIETPIDHQAGPSKILSVADPAGLAAIGIAACKRRGDVPHAAVDGEGRGGDPLWRPRAGRAVGQAFRSAAGHAQAGQIGRSD